MKNKLEVLIAEMYSSGIFYFEAKREFNKRFILHALRANNGNQCRAARELVIHRNTLARTLAELKLRPEEWDPRLQLRGHLPNAMKRSPVEPNGTYAKFSRAKRRAEKLDVIHSELERRA